MKFLSSAIAPAMMLTVGLSATANAETVVKTGQIDVETRVYQIMDKDLTKVDFAEGSATLTDASLTKLADFVKATKDEAKIDRYLVATWADKEFPEKGELSGAQRELAKSRSEHIKKALEAAGAKKVDTFEMTKQPNWIQRAFSTETAEIKGKGLNTTAHQRLLKEIGKRLRDAGGPQTAVIVAKFKNEVLSH